MPVPSSYSRETFECISYMGDHDRGIKRPKKRPKNCRKWRYANIGVRGGLKIDLQLFYGDIHLKHGFLNQKSHDSISFGQKGGFPGDTIQNAFSYQVKIWYDSLL